jgi:hypothetical protein
MVVVGNGKQVQTEDQGQQGKQLAHKLDRMQGFTGCRQLGC